MPETGYSMQRIDAVDKVNGKAKYPGDIDLKGQLYMKVLFANMPHAIIRSVDTSQAAAVKGVIAVLTAKDVPNNEYGLISPDQPVLCGPGSNNAYADHVRFIGDQVALVIAEDEKIAEKARKLIKVDYEPLEAITTIEKALKDKKPLVHPDRGSNTFCHYKIRKGEQKEKMFGSADVIVESVYKTPAQEHAFLQPEAGLAYYDDEGRITVVTGGQWVHEDQEQIAHALDLPLDKIRVIYPAIGGAFGGREDMSVQIVLALAVLRLKEKGIQRPVKTIWSREESIIGHHKRHPYYIKTRWGAKKDGTLTDAEVEIIADGGAYMYTSTKVLGNATLLCTGPYRIPNVCVDSYAVYTNNIPNGAFRGFGGPQGAFCAEMQMNKLAEKLGIDPVELRMKNFVKEGESIAVQTPLPEGISIEKVTDLCAIEAGWRHTSPHGYQKEDVQQAEKGSFRKGIGFACGLKNIGFSYGVKENCWAGIEIHGNEKIEKVILKHAGAEVGQGSHTVFIQMAARALEISTDIIELTKSDTSLSENSGSVSASRMTFMAGNAIKGACELALEKWKNEERPAIAEFKYFAPQTSPFDPETGACRPNFAYGYVAEAVECTVDIETGQVVLDNIICTDDVGAAINPQLVEGQIEGCIVQAAGYSIMEDFIQKDGYTLTNRLSTYLIPTVKDIPVKTTSIIVEEPDLVGPWGARGVGEMPYLPLPAAIAAAIHSATGVWIDEFPYTAERVYKHMHEEK